MLHSESAQEVTPSVLQTAWRRALRLGAVFDCIIMDWLQALTSLVRETEAKLAQCRPASVKPAPLAKKQVRRQPGGQDGNLS